MLFTRLHPDKIGCRFSLHLYLLRRIALLVAGLLLFSLPSQGFKGQSNPGDSATSQANMASQVSYLVADSTGSADDTSQDLTAPNQLLEVKKTYFTFHLETLLHLSQFGIAYLASQYLGDKTEDSEQKRRACVVGAMVLTGVALGCWAWHFKQKAGFWPGWREAVLLVLFSQQAECLGVTLLISSVFAYFSPNVSLSSQIVIAQFLCPFASRLFEPLFKKLRQVCIREWGSHLMRLYDFYDKRSGDTFSKKVGWGERILAYLATHWSCLALHMAMVLCKAEGSEQTGYRIIVACFVITSIVPYCFGKLLGSKFEIFEDQVRETIENKWLLTGVHGLLYVLSLTLHALCLLSPLMLLIFGNRGLFQLLIFSCDVLSHIFLGSYKGYTIILLFTVAYQLINQNSSLTSLKNQENIIGFFLQAIHSFGEKLFLLSSPNPSREVSSPPRAAQGQVDYFANLGRGHCLGSSQTYWERLKSFWSSS